MRNAILVTLLLATMAGLVSCGGGQGRGDKLKDAIFYFNEGVRWGRLQDVLSRIDPEFEPHFLELHKDFGRNLKIVSYEIVNTRVDLEKGTAEVGITMSWYRVDEMVEHNTVIMQFWKEEKREWYVSREEFRSGTPF